MSMPINKFCNNQDGMASVEMVLIAPILLLFMVMMIHAARSMLLKEAVVIRARTDVWRAELLGLNCSQTYDSFGGKKIDAECSYAPSTEKTNFVKKMRKEGLKFWNQDPGSLTKVLDNDNPNIRIGQAETKYLPLSGRGPLVTISSQHAVVANPIWERSDMSGPIPGLKGVQKPLTIGYDNYLKWKLNSTVLFPDYFPCATGTPSSFSSAEKGPQCQ